MTLLLVAAAFARDDSVCAGAVHSKTVLDYPDEDVDGYLWRERARLTVDDLVCLEQQGWDELLASAVRAYAVTQAERDLTSGAAEIRLPLYSREPLDGAEAGALLADLTVDWLTLPRFGGEAGYATFLEDASLPPLGYSTALPRPGVVPISAILGEETARLATTQRTVRVEMLAGQPAPGDPDFAASTYAYVMVEGGDAAPWQITVLMRDLGDDQVLANTQLVVDNPPLPEAPPARSVPAELKRPMVWAGVGTSALGGATVAAALATDADRLTSVGQWRALAGLELVGWGLVVAGPAIGVTSVVRERAREREAER